MTDQLLNRIIDTIKANNGGKYYDYVLPGFMAKQFVTYSNIISDLEFVMNATLELLKRDKNEVISNALWTSLLVTYGKCFTDATSSKLPKLEVKDCFYSTGKEHLEVHKRLMFLRHNFVAHRGTTDQEASVGYMRMDIDTLERQIRVKGLKRVIPSNQELSDILLLVKHLIPLVHKKYRTAAEKAAAAQLKEFTPKQLEFMRIK